MIRILLADDHVLVREGLVGLLHAASDIRVVAAVSQGEQALEQIETLRPDVAVLDIAMPLLSGIDVARRMRDEGLRTAVVLLSMHREPAHVRAALEAGVSGYVVKEAASDDLINAIRAADAGELYLSPAVARTAASVLRENERGDEEELTARERDVMRLLARGLSSKEIANRLALSVRTVDFHRANIMDKLGIRNIPGLVKYAIRHGLATLDD